MKVLKFNLSGEFAFFKNETINDMYDTYPHIHKPSLLGLFGAMLGYNGYAQTQKVFGQIFVFKYTNEDTEKNKNNSFIKD